MKNTIVYIDGYNLYYGLLKGTANKWLDLMRFSKELLGPEHNVVSVKYFTSWVKPHPYDPAAIERQNVYLQAVQSLVSVETTLGFYSKRRKMLPAVDESCRRCPTAPDGLVRAASYYKNIPRDLPARCQLPDAIPVGTHGNFIRRPAAW